MRIVGGRFSGRKIKPPSSLAIRPTTDRVRQSIFNIIQHGAKKWGVTPFEGEQPDETNKNQLAEPSEESSSLEPDNLAPRLPLQLGTIDQLEDPPLNSAESDDLATSSPAFLQDARVLDLFAGTGALAFEALSRGASFAVLVDHGAEARGLLRTNIEALGLGGVTRILRRDATKLGDCAPFTPFHLIFCDPPYGYGLGEKALIAALIHGWLQLGALVVLEERANVAVDLPPAFQFLERREAGDTQILFYLVTKIG